MRQCDFCGHVHRDGPDKRCGVLVTEGGINALPCGCDGVIEGLTPVEPDKPMPYPLYGPAKGARGWVGAVLLYLLLGILYGLTTLPMYGLIIAVPLTIFAVELLRTDAIRQHGAIVVTLMDKRGLLDTFEGYWPTDPRNPNDA